MWSTVLLIVLLMSDTTASLVCALVLEDALDTQLLDLDMLSADRSPWGDVIERRGYR